MKKTSIGRTGTYDRSVIGHTGTYYPSDTADKREVARTAPHAYSGVHALIVNQYTQEHTRMYQYDTHHTGMYLYILVYTGI